MADNIVHLVLARLPDAPAGTKGISLFVVPKFKVNADGSWARATPSTAVALEHKMGIHGNATCQMNLDGAVGSLVGQPHKGLAAMFVMMNAARLGVGNQSLGLTEVAYQNAWPTPRTASRCAACRAQGARQAGRPHHRAPRRAQDAADRPRLRRRRPRAGDTYTAMLIDKELNQPDEDERKDAADWWRC
jgi:alkylation response protein AidB-like acyl-CoA dehydrogenase